MNILGHFRDFTESFKGERVITFSVENSVDKRLISSLDTSKIYTIEIKEFKNRRSLQQNAYLWKLIHEIAKKTNHDDNDIYCYLLEKADALSDYIITQTEMEEALRKTFRGIKFIRKQQVNSLECNVYKVYLGSSKMNTKEMTELLESAINLAYEVGVPIEYAN